MARKNASSQRLTNQRLDRYETDSMGLPVVLVNSAVESSFDGEEGIVVPDIKGLEAAMAVARATIADKLSGKEIRFLRKAVGLTAVRLAEFLDVVPETLSRWENESGASITTNPERILRMRVLRALKQKARGVPAKVDDVLDMKFLGVRTSLGPIKLIFERMMALADESPQCVWVFRGLEKSDVAEEATKNVA